MSFNPKQPMENEIKGQGEIKKQKPKPNSDLIVPGHISGFSTPSAAAHSGQGSFDIFTLLLTRSPHALLSAPRLFPMRSNSFSPGLLYNLLIWVFFFHFIFFPFVFFLTLKTCFYKKDLFFFPFFLL